MSRSYRHTPIVGMTTHDSEKADKRIWHSRMRAHERANLATCSDWEEFQTTEVRAVSDPWLMDKDGRQYLGLAAKAWLQRCMRK